MKIIDLLNKIAKGEEVPKKIRFDDTYWNRICGEKYTYYIDKDNDNDLFIYFFRKNLTFNLNDEIEIIEEDKKDEEIELYFNGKKVDITDIFDPLKQGEYFYKENGKWYVHRLKNVSFVIEEDKTIENIKVKSTFTRNQKKIARKINEIIDYLNKEE